MITWRQWEGRKLFGFDSKGQQCNLEWLTVHRWQVNWAALRERVLPRWRKESPDAPLSESKTIHRVNVFIVEANYRLNIIELVVTLQALVNMAVTEIWLQTESGIRLNNWGTHFESAYRRSVRVASFWNSIWRARRANSTTGWLVETHTSIKKF